MSEHRTWGKRTANDCGEESEKERVWRDQSGRVRGGKGKSHTAMRKRGGTTDRQGRGGVDGGAGCRWRKPVGVANGGAVEGDRNCLV